MITINKINNEWFFISKKTLLKSLFIKFLFPYYPLKFFKSIQLITFLAFLLALHIILVYIGFNIPVINLQVGFDWLPTYLAGWFYGPIIGPIFGFVANNISWLQTGGTFWYWMYAIQEPIIALFASIMSFYFFYSAKSSSIIKNIILQQFFFISFFIICLIIITLSYEQKIYFNKKPLNKTNVLYGLTITAICIFCIFFVFMEGLIIYFLYKKKKHQNFKVFLVSSIVITSMIFLFAIATGPIINISFLYHFNFINNDKLTGLIYLTNAIAQVLMQFIRMPIAIFLFYAILLVCIKPFNKIIKSSFYRYIV